MEHQFLLWLPRYGAPLLFTAQMLGIFGLPIPDEFLLTVAGTLIREGRLDPWWTALAAIAGCMAGITVSYVLGRTIGLAAMHRLVRVPDETVERTHRWFSRFGRWLLAFGYFIPGVRHVTAIAAGSVPIGFGEFAAFAYTGAALWSLTFLGLGYFAGRQSYAIVRAARGVLLPVAIVVGAVLVTVIVVRWRRASR